MDEPDIDDPVNEEDDNDLPGDEDEGNEEEPVDIDVPLQSPTMAIDTRLSKRYPAMSTSSDEAHLSLSPVRMTSLQSQLTPESAVTTERPRPHVLDIHTSGKINKSRSRSTSPQKSLTSARILQHTSPSKESN